MIHDIRIHSPSNPCISLQCNYILVQGGNFSVGTPETPYPGTARITIWGAPNDPQLPLYGSKV